MSRVDAAAELPAAWRTASALDPVVIAERWISGGEYTVAVLQGEALPAIRIETPRAFYDYQAKYFADDTRYLIPCGLATEAEASLQRMALATFAATGASGWGRVDFVMDDDGRGDDARDQHRARHDRSLAGADGRARGRHRFRRACLARARDQLRAGEDLNMALFRRRNRRRPAGRRFEMPQLEWTRATRVAGAVAALVALTVLLAVGLDQPVRSFVIDGPFQRVAAVEVQQASLGALKGGFVSADLDRLRKAVEALTWVDRARVQRLWPNRIRIEIVEQQAAARWGEDGLLNTRGEVIATGVRHVPPELPRLEGPEGTESLVAQRFLAMQDRLGSLGLQVAALRLDARGAWELDLSTGVTVRLGRRQVDQRMDRFVGFAAQVIAGHAADIRYVDMRYSNGFAIGWRGNRRPKDDTPVFAGQLQGDPGIDG